MKDKLRSITLGKATQLKRIEVTLDGEKFEVRQPTLKERGEFRSASMKLIEGKDGKGAAEFSLGEFQLQCVVGLTMVPGTDEPVFTMADRDVIMNGPASGWFDELSKVASELCNISDDDVKKA